MVNGRRIFIPAVLSLAVAAALPGCGPADAGSASGTAGIPAKSIKLGQSTDGGFSGKINPDQEVKIVSKISGKVAAVQVEEGAKVKQGDVLVQLETDDLQQQVKQAEAALTAAKAKLADTQAGARTQEIQAAESAVRAAQGSLDQTDASVQQAKAGFDLATSTYNRLRNQYDSSSAVSKEDLDRGKLEYEKARTGYEQVQAARQAAAAQVDAAKSKLDLTRAGATANTIQALQAEVDRLTAALELSKSSLANASVIAPSDGVVVKKSINTGELAAAGTPLFSVVNMNKVQIELSVTEGQIGSVKAGTAVNVKVPTIPDKTFEGSVTFVSPVSNANSNTFPVKVTVPNPDGLLFAGMVAEVTVKGTTQAGLEVPKSAVVHKDNKDYVVKVEDQSAKLLEVKTTEKNKDWVYVQPTDKLRANEQVVVNPSDSMTDGAKLKVE